MTDRVSLSQPLPPNGTIGIIGGGQLGRMLASSAARLGFRTIVLEPQDGCPAAQLCNRQIVAAYDDEAALQQLVETCDVVTYEFENVPLAAAKFIQDRRPLHPPASALEVSQDRLVEKQFLQSCGVGVAPFRDIATRADLAKALDTFGGGILKTRRFGYDGKGQHRFDPDASRDTPALDAALASSANEGGWVLEKLVAFDHEFSIIATAALDDSITMFDAARNTHENGILRKSVVPSGISESARASAAGAVEAILKKLDYVGTIGVEFFDTADGVLVNEIAPRVHNTGHWTVEACATSQFDQHIRAIAGLPLGDTARHADCEMTNLLDAEADGVSQLLIDRNAHVTLYGKADAKPGRKMGHVTVLKGPATIS